MRQALGIHRFGAKQASGLHMVLKRELKNELSMHSTLTYGLLCVRPSSVPLIGPCDAGALFGHWLLGEFM